MEGADGEEQGGPVTSLRKKACRRIYHGWRALPIKLVLRASILRYLLQRKRFPLFTLSPSRGGLLKSYRLQRTAKIRKIVRHNGRIYHNLILPGCPSKPYDRMVANGGLNIAAAGTPWKRQVDNVILAVTPKCAYDCRHCYEKHNLSTHGGIPFERWKSVIAELQNRGVSIITLSGGEPMLDFELVVALLDGADKDLSEFHLNTSGHAVTRERAATLRKAGLSAVGVGLDDYDEGRHDVMRGYRGAFQEAVQAVRTFQDAGLLTYLNTCLSRELVHSDHLERFLDLARDLEVGIVRLLEPRPCGGYFATDPDALFSEKEREKVKEFFLEVNSARKYRGHPLVVYPAYFEVPEKLGCLMAGLSQLYIDAKGNVEPCVFLPVSFGNIMADRLEDILAKMRQAVPVPLRRRCPSLELAGPIRDKRSRGCSLPIPFEELREAWHMMNPVL